MYSGQFLEPPATTEQHEIWLKKRDSEIGCNITVQEFWVYNNEVSFGCNITVSLT